MLVIDISALLISLIDNILAHPVQLFDKQKNNYYSCFHNHQDRDGIAINPAQSGFKIFHGKTEAQVRWGK